ncbi:hypothetical protein Lal_00012577 [Lupinus albus]|nr:hypothetical protein Lal_00012577 [Lupinus albus]
MTPADFTLSTPRANLLSVLPPRRRTGARVEPFISGVTTVKRKKILRSRNIRAGEKKKRKKGLGEEDGVVMVTVELIRLRKDERKVDMYNSLEVVTHDRYSILRRKQPKNGEHWSSLEAFGGDIILTGSRSPND